MTPAALDPPARRVLRALYELAQLDRSAHVGLLARAAGLPSSLANPRARDDSSLANPRARFDVIDVGRVLRALEARGLVSAEHARLTLRGLAFAVRCEPLGLQRAAWLRRSSLARPRARVDRPACDVRAPGLVGLRPVLRSRARGALRPPVVGLRPKSAAGARPRLSLAAGSRSQ